MKSLPGFVLAAVITFVLGLVAPRPQAIEKLPWLSKPSEYQLKGKAVSADFAQQIVAARIVTDLSGEKAWERRHAEYWKFSKDVKLEGFLESVYHYDNHVSTVVRVSDSFIHKQKTYNFKGLVKIDYDAALDKKTGKLVWFVENTHILAGEATFPPPPEEERHRRGLFHRWDD